MIGLSAGLEIARKALSAYQLAISVYGNNIANVNTPGFSRRRQNLSESGYAEFSFGRVGLGVDTESITRMRDRFLDVAYRKENSAFGKYDGLQQTLSQIEVVFGEPSDLGLGTALRDFWDAWQELANEPESVTPRDYVLGKANTLCRSLNRLSTSLSSMRETLDGEITGYVDEVNSLAARIAQLNGKIVSAEPSGKEASDLRDKRDLLIDELSGIVDVQVFEGKDGSASVKLGTETLVERTYAVPLSTVTRGDRGISVSDIAIGGTVRVIRVSGGKLGGLLESRDRVIPNYMSRLDEIARVLVTEVNAVHRTGYGLDGSTNLDFFDQDKITAQTIRVSDAILVDVSRIAASTDGSPGNGDNALAVSDLRLAGLFGDEGATSDEYYNSTIGNLGIEATRAADDKEGQNLLLMEIDTRRESVKGVSIDEEMTNLVAAQHAFQAAAKLVSVIDSLFETMMTTV